MCETPEAEALHSLAAVPEFITRKCDVCTARVPKDNHAPKRRQVLKGKPPRRPSDRIEDDIDSALAKDVVQPDGRRSRWKRASIMMRTDLVGFTAVLSKA
jgi:hypothetical protein